MNGKELNAAVVQYLEEHGWERTGPYRQWWHPGFKFGYNTTGEALEDTWNFIDKVEEEV